MKDLKFECELRKRSRRRTIVVITSTHVIKLHYFNVVFKQDPSISVDNELTSLATSRYTPRVRENALHSAEVPAPDLDRKGGCGNGFSGLFYESRRIPRSGRKSASERQSSREMWSSTDFWTREISQLLGSINSDKQDGTADRTVSERITVILSTERSDSTTPAILPRSARAVPGIYP